MFTVKLIYKGEVIREFSDASMFHIRRVSDGWRKLYPKHLWEKVILEVTNDNVNAPINSKKKSKAILPPSRYKINL